jgi:hypothetical protein
VMAFSLFRDPKPDLLPTDTRPGSAERIAIYQKRAAAGYSIFHPGDRQLRDDEPGASPLGDERVDLPEGMKRIRRGYSVRVRVGSIAVSLGIYANVEDAMAAKQKFIRKIGRLLWKRFGVKRTDKEQRARLFRMLGKNVIRDTALRLRWENKSLFD